MTDEPYILGHPTAEALTERLLSPMWRPTTKVWLLALGGAGVGMLFFFGLILYTVWFGIGLWGNNIPVGWAFGIINFVFWIEVAHAGTFISAVLLLLEQRWRTTINRIAEAMTLIAVLLALVFPLLHLGRPWFAYWLLPYPSVMDVWPQFKSSLTWDAVAVPAYGLVSLLFWYVGMIPDLGALRDRAPGLIRRQIYGVLALGWHNSARAQRHYRVAYGVMAGLITALVIMVISVISSDFAIAVEPGWHSTLFPPYFIAAALLSGFGGVTTLVIAVRYLFGLEEVITLRHLDILGKMLIATGLATLYCYIVEFFIGWYAGSPFERYTYWVQFFHGPQSWVWWLTLVCTVATQLLWWRRLRTQPLVMLAMSLIVNLGMWGDRFSLIVLPLERDFLPASWHPYSPTWVDWGITGGAFATFAFFFLLFVRYVPFIPVSETKELAHALLNGDD